MTYKYDDEGNIVGEEQTFLPGPSPLGAFMGKHADKEEWPENQEFVPDLGWDEEPVHVEPANVRRLLDPDAVSTLPQFRTLTLSDLDNLPDPEWLVENVIPQDAMTTIYGAPGSTKSFYALDIACSIASGHNFNGSAVKKGKVIYCVGEGLRGMKWRIEAWKLAHPEADIEALHKNLIILPRAVLLLDKTEASMLTNTAEAIHGEVPLRMFIIDTLARALTGGDENSAQDVGLAIHVCETVRAKTGASPLIVHHSGAEGSRERGSTALRGATDTTIHMAHDETEGIITVTCKKMKDGEPFAPVRFTLKQYGHSIVLTPAIGLQLGKGGAPAGQTLPPRDREYYAKMAEQKRNSPF